MTERVCVIGAGTIAPGVAADFARAGDVVTLIARDAAKAATAAATAKAGLATLAAGGVITDEQATTAQARIAAVALDEAAPVLAQATLISENIVEDIAAKHALYTHIEKLCAPDALILSNTSGLSLTTLAQHLARPQRFAGAHYLNPAHLTLPVEITSGSQTSAETVERLVALYKSMGKLPIVVKRDVPGLIWNRLQFAVLREALWLVENGIADADAIDTAIEAGLGLRWSVTGPLKTVDLGGHDTFLRIASYLFAELSNADSPPQSWRDGLRRAQPARQAGAASTNGTRQR